MDIENRELKGSNPSLRKVFLLNNKTTNTMSTQRAVNHTKQSQLFSSRKLNLVTLFLFFGILFFSSKSFAQNLENESRIIEYLGEERYFELTKKIQLI